VKIIIRILTYIYILDFQDPTHSLLAIFPEINLEMISIKKKIASIMNNAHSNGEGCRLKTKAKFSKKTLKSVKIVGYDTYESGYLNLVTPTTQPLMLLKLEAHRGIMEHETSKFETE
jgi:hypothetical protein